MGGHYQRTIIIIIFLAIWYEVVSSVELDRIPSGTVENAKKASMTNGAVFIDGEKMLLTDKLAQRVTPGGTMYFLLSSPTGKALYKRREMDTGRNIILFPDPNFPPGDGHYVVLMRLVTNFEMTQPRGPIYQGFYLILGDGLHAYMSKWRKETHVYKPGELARLQREKNDKLRMEHKTFNVEFSEVEASRMVKRIKRENGSDILPPEEELEKRELKHSSEALNTNASKVL